jgi:hypothetical protein
MADELTHEKDFGRTDRYANKDEQRETEICNVAETKPAEQKGDEDPDEPTSDVNRDE